MNKFFEKIFFKIGKLPLLVLSVILDILLTCFLFYLGDCFKSYSFISEIFNFLSVIAFGNIFLTFNYTKNYIDEKYEEKKKLYQLQNLSFLTKEELKNNINFEKIHHIELNEKEVNS